MRYSGRGRRSRPGSRCRLLSFLVTELHQRPRDLVTEATRPELPFFERLVETHRLPNGFLRRSVAADYRRLGTGRNPRSRVARPAADPGALDGFVADYGQYAVRRSATTSTRSSPPAHDGSPATAPAASTPTTSSATSPTSITRGAGPASSASSSIGSAPPQQPYRRAPAQPGGIGHRSAGYSDAVLRVSWWACRGSRPEGYGPVPRSALTLALLGRVPVVRLVVSSVGPAGALLS